jgi:hypothetical protein
MNYFDYFLFSRQIRLNTLGNLAGCAPIMLRSLAADADRIIFTFLTPRDFCALFASLRAVCVLTPRRFCALFAEWDTTYTLAVHIAASVTKASFEKQKQYLAASEAWTAEWEMKAKDPGYVPQLPCDDGTDEPLENMFMQFQSEFFEGLDDFILCRHKSCMFVCRNQDWLNTIKEGGWQFRCPKCGRQYFPFRMTPAYLPFNKVMILEEDKPASSSEGLKRPAGSSEGPVQLIPYHWPDTATTVLQDRIKMITMGLAEEIAEVPREARLQYVIDLLNTKRVPGYFKHYPLTIDVKVKIDALTKKFSYDHILDGFYGFFFSELETTPPLKQEDVMRMWGHSTYLVKTDNTK